MLIIVALFIIQLKQLIYQKILRFKIVGIYKKHCLSFQSTQRSFFTYFFCFGIYVLVDSEYIINVYKSVKFSTGTAMRNPEMLKFVLDHLKTKKMYKHVVKLLFVMRYVSD